MTLNVTLRRRSRAPHDARRSVLLVGHHGSHEVLAAARELGRRGWTVHVATGARRSLAGGSRYVASEHRVRPPDVDVDLFIMDVNAALCRCRASIVVGCGDPELLSLSAMRQQILAEVAMASHANVMSAVDKWSLTQAAVTVGLSVPRTVVVTADTVDTWRGPAVVKPRLHWQPGMPAANYWTPTTLVHSPSALADAVGNIHRGGRDPVVQEPIAGALMALSAVRAPNGAPLALMQQRALGTWPPKAGVSSRAITVPVDPALGRGVASLLDHLGWVGMAQVQFVEPSQGPARLIDFNGRPYGSLPLAQAAGVDLVALWLDAWLEQDLVADDYRPPLACAHPDVIYSRGIVDVRRALHERRGGLACDLAATSQAWWGAAHPVLDLTDLRPLTRSARPSLLS